MTLTPKFLAEKTWDLYQTHGVPIEVSEDILESHGLELDQKYLQTLIHQHQELSKTTSADQFKSGLDQDSAKTRRLHTATHILHQALRDLFGNEVKQMGSAITNQKARFDFSFDRKLTESELIQLQNKIQAVINTHASMHRVEMDLDEAKKLNAIGLFGEKYGEIVTIYTLKTPDGKILSREFCGGPHIENTDEIGNFIILKQKSIGQNIKRLEFDVL